MKQNSIVFITNQYALVKVKDKESLIFEYRNYYPNKIPWDFTDIFDEPDVFFYVIESIMKSVPRTLWKRISTRNRLILFSIDELKSKLRKRLFEEAFYRANYGTLVHIEIGPMAVVAAEKKGYETPAVVVVAIGQVVELSFCFEGALITKQVIRNSLNTEFDEFVRTCKKLQDKDLLDCIDNSGINRQDFDKMRRAWDEKRGIQIIIASNNNSFDYPVDREIRYDHRVSFSQIIELLKDF